MWFERYYTIKNHYYKNEKYKLFFTIKSHIRRVTLQILNYMFSSLPIGAFHWPFTLILR